MITFWAGALFGAVLLIAVLVVWMFALPAEDDDMEAARFAPVVTETGQTWHPVGHPSSDLKAARVAIETDAAPPTVEGGLSSLTVDGEPVWCCEEAALAYPAPCPEHAPLRDVAGYMAAPQHGNPRALGMWPKP